MVHKTSGQLGFADAWLGNNPKLNQRLDKSIFFSPFVSPSYNNIEISKNSEQPILHKQLPSLQKTNEVNRDSLLKRRIVKLGIIAGAAATAALLVSAMFKQPAQPAAPPPVLSEK